MADSMESQQGVSPQVTANRKCLLVNQVSGKPEEYGTQLVDGATRKYTGSSRLITNRLTNKQTNRVKEMKTGRVSGEL